MEEMCRLLRDIQQEPVKAAHNGRREDLFSTKKGLFSPWFLTSGLGTQGANSDPSISYCCLPYHGNCDMHTPGSSSHQHKPTINLLAWSKLVRLICPHHPRTSRGAQQSLWLRGKMQTLGATVLQSPRQSQPGSAPAPCAMIFISHSPCLFQLER